MLSIGSAHQLWLYGKAVDFRKGFDGLCGVVRDQMGRDPLSGEVFIFINRRRNKLKLLLWEKGGLVLWYKRLEEGQFEWLEGVKGGKQLSYLQLGMLNEGVSLEGRKARKRDQKKGLIVAFENKNENLRSMDYSALLAEKDRQNEALMA